MFDDTNLAFIGKSHMATIRHLGQVIEQIEAQVSCKVTIRDDFKMLRTTPGIGLILGLTIMLEVGDIARLKKVGNYLSWAYIEAAYHAIRCNKHAQRFIQRKMAKSNSALQPKLWPIS